MTSISRETLPIMDVKLLYGENTCTKSEVCNKYCTRFQKRMIGKYVSEGEPFNGQLVSAVIDLNNFDYAEYISKVKKIHKGNAYRDAKKSDREGFYCKQFCWNNFIPDIVEINQSKEIRSGGKMRSAYNRSVVELGGEPEIAKPIQKPKCSLHCTYNWGIFEKKTGYTQGKIVTDEKLLAYIKFKRIGNYSVYTSILGHGNFLKFGIMYRLHYAIMEWINENIDGNLKGLKFILYGALDSGNDGLRQWKKRALFQGAYLSCRNDRSNFPPCGSQN